MPCLRLGCRSVLFGWGRREKQNPTDQRRLEAGLNLWFLILGACYVAHIFYGKSHRKGVFRFFFDGMGVFVVLLHLLIYNLK